jgi:hypothetical protein
MILFNRFFITQCSEPIAKLPKMVHPEVDELLTRVKGFLYRDGLLVANRV